MSAQFNAPPYFGGIVNANIDANRNTPLDLTGASDGFPLYSPPILVNIYYDVGVQITVALPGNYPPRNANVVFQWRESGSQRYTPFTVNEFSNPSEGVTVWTGITTQSIETNTAYEIIATSGNYSSPVLRIATGTPDTGEPTSAPTVPVIATTPTVSTIIVYFNAGFTGGDPLENTIGVNFGPTPDTTVVLPSLYIQNPFGSLYTATINGLEAGTIYYVRSTVTGPNGVILRSLPSAPINTSEAGGVAPDPAPDAPTFVTATSTTLTVQFDGADADGDPAPFFGVYVGTTETPDVDGVFIQATVNGGIGVATAVDLVPGGEYYFMAAAENGVAPNAVSDVAGPFQTAPAPVGPLKTNAVVPFLIQGPRFNTQATTALDYYINVDAVGCYYVVGTNTKTQGAQLFGAMYASSAVANGAPSYAGLCIADQPYNQAFGPQTEDYLTRTTIEGDTRLLLSWGGFYADILGLFKRVPTDYQPPGPPGWVNPTAANAVTSILYNYCHVAAGGPGAANPLNWQNQGYSGVRFDGIVLDFENVGYGGNPTVNNTFPLPQNPLPSFPADATNPKYAPYIAALASIVTTVNVIDQNIFLANAPVSLSICQAETLAAPKGGNICAANSALNTWFAFASASTVPNHDNYNDVDSLALNHPSQMAYFDDIFVQFYNENADNYLGGVNFTNLLAQWGYVAILAQKEAVSEETGKVPKINIGLASGNITPGLNAAGNAVVPSVLGPTPPLADDPGPPFKYWYPQYGAGSPPNQTSPVQDPSWPNTGPTLDAVNLSAAILNANTILQYSLANPTLVPSQWCSGMGFWAGGNATTMAQAVYSGQARSAFSPGTILPQQNVYCWSDASYPAPDPGWVGKNGVPTFPIVNNLIVNQQKKKPFNSKKK